MKRRTLLGWICRLLSGLVMAVVGLPGIRFVLQTFQTPSGEIQDFRRVARLSDLKQGRPTMVVLTGSKTDAWTRHASQVLGRIWLVRREKSGEAEAVVDAFSSICPHMGCQVHFQSESKQFVCPCHQGLFQLDGSPTKDSAPGKTKLPRGLDQLECRIVAGATPAESWIEVKYEKFELGKTQKVPLA